MEIIEIK